MCRLDGLHVGQFKRHRHSRNTRVVWNDCSPGAAKIEARAGSVVSFEEDPGLRGAVGADFAAQFQALVQVNVDPDPASC